jgi:hypothetical protein
LTIPPARSCCSGRAADPALDHPFQDAVIKTFDFYIANDVNAWQTYVIASDGGFSWGRCTVPGLLTIGRHPDRAHA